MSAKVGNHKSTVCFQCGVQQSLVIAANRGLCAVNVGIGSLIINNGTFVLKQAIPLTYCSVISVPTCILVSAAWRGSWGRLPGVVVSCEGMELAFASIRLGAVVLLGVWAKGSARHSKGKAHFNFICRSTFLKRVRKVITGEVEWSEGVWSVVEKRLIWREMKNGEWSEVKWRSLVECVYYHVLTGMQTVCALVYRMSCRICILLFSFCLLLFVEF